MRHHPPARPVLTPKLSRLILLLTALWSQTALWGQEFRALWVDAFRPGFKTRAEVRQLVSDARAANFNALLVEVRRRGDVYYRSAFEPKALDIADNFDPLAELLAQAHEGRPRLEIHAWMVVYPVWNQISLPPAQPRHVFRLHPDWLTRNSAGQLWNGSNFVLDPGHPAVENHLCNVALELVSRYEIDGLHLDYIRYDSNLWGYNPLALQRFQQLYGRRQIPAPLDPEWLQFRRDQVTALVRRIYLSALAIKPQVKISAATIAWAPGITTDAEWPGSAAYAIVLQDWRGWLQQGILDLNIPMAYFRQTMNPVDWGKWSDFAKEHRYHRQVALGAGLYLNSVSNSLFQLRSTRQPTVAAPPAEGWAGFSYALPSSRGFRDEFLRALAAQSGSNPQPPLSARPATIPAMPWKTAPTAGFLKGLVLHQSTGLPLDGATVIFGKARGAMTTDGTGFYGAAELRPGTYILTAGAKGFTPQSAQISISAGRVTSCDFRLSPRARFP